MPAELMSLKFPLQPLDFQNSDVPEVPQKTHSLCGYSRVIPGVLSPHSLEEVRKLVQQAARSNGKMKLSVCSRGQNWGFGSNLPADEEAFLMDLSGLNRIRSTAIKNHSVELEAGVTQGQLDEWLAAQGRTHFFNATGAGLGASVIGNALERGIGYSGSRYLDLIELEVMLPSGELIRTSKQKAFTSIGYGPGLGPDLTSLFCQSNFGMVTAATIRLFKCPEIMGGITCKTSQDQLPKLMLAIADLISEGAGYGVPHIFNRARIITSFSPYLDEAGRAHIEQTASDWTALYPVKGSKAVFEATVSHLKEVLGPLGEIDVLRNSSGSQLNPLLEGRPTDFPLASVAYSVFGRESDRKVPMEESGAGLIHITPTFSISTGSIDQALRSSHHILNKYGAAGTPISINILSPGSAVMVISLGFDRRCSARTEHARKTANALTREFADNGMLPYRLHLNQADHLPKMDDPWPSLFHSLKQVFDPENIIADSKYSPLWNPFTTSNYASL